MPLGDAGLEHLPDFTGNTSGSTTSAAHALQSMTYGEIRALACRRFRTMKLDELRRFLTDYGLE